MKIGIGRWVSFLLVVVLSVGVAAGATAAAGSESAGLTERQRLFAASQAMVERRDRSPQYRAGIIVTDMGTAEQVSTGGRLEYRLDPDDRVRAVLEGVYLESDEGAEVASLASLKVIAPEIGSGSPYAGVGVGITGPYRYQAFAGIEFRNHFFAEMKLMNTEWTFRDPHVYFAVGFLLSF